MPIHKQLTLMSRFLLVNQKHATIFLYFQSFTSNNVGECSTRLFGGIKIKTLFPYETCLEIIIILESPSCGAVIGTEMTHFTSTAIIQESRRSSVCSQQDRFLWFWEEGRTSWPCCSRLKVLSVGLSLVLHQGSLHPFSRPALFPLLASSPTICTDLPNERTGIWCTELARGALSYQTHSLSAPGNRPRTHRFLNGLHYIDQTPWRHLALSLSLVCERDVCFHKYLTASPCFSLSSLASLWPLSRIGTGSEGWAGKQWPLMERLVLFHMHVCVCWRTDKISFVNRNPFQYSIFKVVLSND